MSQVWSKMLILFAFAATLGGTTFASVHSDCGDKKRGIEFSLAKQAMENLHATNALPCEQEKRPVKEISFENEDQSGELANNAHTQKPLFSPRLLKWALDPKVAIKIINTDSVYPSSQNFPEAVLRFRKESFLSIVALE